MKKLIAVFCVLAAVTGALFAGPGADGSVTGKKLIGVVTPAADHGFTGESIRHGEAETKAIAAKLGCDYRYLTANESGEQNNHIDTLIGLKPAVIVLWPINGDELRSAAQKIVDAKIPLIIYDRFITGFRGQAADISGDNVTIGKMMGTYFSKYFAAQVAAGKVNYLQFLGDSSTVPKERADGFKSTANPNFTIVQSFVTDWSSQKAQEQLETFLNTAPRAQIESIQAIYTDDDEEVIGIVNALKNYRGPAKLNIKLISGVGGRRENMPLFENSGLPGVDFLTYWFSPSFIRNAIDLGADIIQGKTPPKDVKIPTREIDKSNYKAHQDSAEFKTRYSI
ncbi:ABC transporter substrate-binding protein [Spirochaetia bacterium]|nr:ABC transporter substrate-binding protein [Spirochaetia bacterium]